LVRGNVISGVVARSILVLADRVALAGVARSAAYASATSQKSECGQESRA
jgi:hypothetical protein